MLSDNLPLLPFSFLQAADERPLMCSALSSDGHLLATGSTGAMVSFGG
jgi:hypothetical protein